MSRAKILILDPDVSWTLALSDALVRENIEMFSANSAADALVLLQVRKVDLMVAEINLSGGDGLALVEQVRQVHPQVRLVVCTTAPSIQQAVQAIKRGAFDYREKPRDLTSLREVKDAILQACVGEATRARPEVADAAQRGLLSTASQGFYGIISQNARMQEIFELIQTIADSQANVLVYGETGTGKELVARAIHEASPRHGKALVTMDCSALARELLESELFGHEKGAFTGAVDRHIGRFERANGGTLFLDEVANIDLGVQAKLLRVLQTRTFERVGGQRSVSVDVRIIAATNKTLEDCVTEGTMREDLYHRLNVVQINVPPLRERVEDIPLLASEFLRRFARQNGKDVRGFSDGAIARLSAYPWPGNVRELENVVLQSVVLAKLPLIESSDLPRRLSDYRADTGAPPTRLVDQLEQPERQILINALRQHEGNIKRTAAMLEISRTTLYAKLRKYNIDPDAVR